MNEPTPRIPPHWETALEDLEQLTRLVGSELEVIQGRNPDHDVCVTTWHTMSITLLEAVRAHPSEGHLQMVQEWLDLTFPLRRNGIGDSGLWSTLVRAYCNRSANALTQIGNRIRFKQHQRIGPKAVAVPDVDLNSLNACTPSGKPAAA